MHVIALNCSSGKTTLCSNLTAAYARQLLLVSSQQVARLGKFQSNTKAALACLPICFGKDIPRVAIVVDCTCLLFLSALDADEASHKVQKPICDFRATID